MRERQDLAIAAPDPAGSGVQSDILNCKHVGRKYVIPHLGVVAFGPIASSGLVQLAAAHGDRLDQSEPADRPSREPPGLAFLVRQEVGGVLVDDEAVAPGDLR